MTTIHNILVVCLGNICRSPMAAGLLRQALPECRIESAGLAPPVGAGADPRAVRLLSTEGCDLAGHRARAIDFQQIAAADLVLVMDSEQRTWLETHFPGALGKTYRLCEHEQTDVPDPIGGSQSMFVIALGLIKLGVDSWSTHVRSVAIDSRGETI